jgi:hypothetical protein
VGRPPQELMRIWDRVPICKDFRPGHRLGIWNTCNLAEEGKKGRHGGQRKELRREAEKRD